MLAYILIKFHIYVVNITFSTTLIENTSFTALEETDKTVKDILGTKNSDNH